MIIIKIIVIIFQFIDLKFQELDYCTNGLNGNKCYQQIFTEISALNSSTLTIIINSDYNFINGVQINILEKFKQLSEMIICSPNPNDFGINLIGNKFAISDILKEVILFQNLKSIETYMDHSNEVFSNVDVWNDKKVEGTAIVH